MSSLEVKIRDTESVEDAFAQVWNKIAFTIGIRKSLTPPELQIIFQFLKEEYKWISLDQIQKAFSLYSANKLDFKDSHFQSLDNPFIGKVLSSYQEWRRKENKKIKPIAVEKQIEMKEEPIDQRRERAYHWIKDCIEKGEEIRIANWTDAFHYCEDKGLIKMTKQEKEDYRDSVKKEIKEKLENSKNDIETVKRLIEMEVSPRSLQVECRKRLVIKCIKETI